ncbi:MAG: lipid-A-disaccharide synthase [Alkalinema sp. CAN_BIN05]|nr:lipid-A-disaccharide synthase [Alkalinema sp. CAN_BIN05]
MNHTNTPIPCDLSIPIDILILSNGPGELSTWVKPVVQQLRQRFGEERSQCRISVVLSPCPNASGQEGEIARSYPEVDRVQDATHFFTFLLWGRTKARWDWRSKGIVLFLGGDPLFPVVLGRRLGYKTVVYAEWETRWRGWIDRFAVMKQKLVDNAPIKNRHKFVVVGDLMSSSAVEDMTMPESINLVIGLLPGSKVAKLAQGVPFMCAVADQLQNYYPDLKFVLPLAPTLTVEQLANYGDAQQNPIVAMMGGTTATLHRSPPESPPQLARDWLETSGGTIIELKTIGDDGPRTPHYNTLRRCTLCLTTIGANTAELGALAIPMIILLPTNQLDAMRAWNGIPGILANLPGIGSLFAKVINTIALRKIGLLAWPNIWAGRSIVPEMVGHLTADQVTEKVRSYLDHPERLEAMKKELRQIRGEPGAAQKLVTIVEDLLNQST